ncbi:hypothetical protein Y032_0342g3015 [Ancylostoma ceylanicum]|uniref:Uncharacterized protein n=1 Tax=Ancylostoma ceylanicum TaxID=53326 RepID=A0A016RXK0_9BILA|nr:hypothetical protein Y032_0342g3015 [Ancylostoma ceylanicum]
MAKKEAGKKLRRSKPHNASDHTIPLRACVNCEINTHDGAPVTSSCKQSKCYGHFCTYASQRHLSHGMGRSGTVQIVTEKQGCINVTDSSQVRSLIHYLVVVVVVVVVDDDDGTG